MSKLRLIKGGVYRIMGFNTKCRAQRARLASLGFVPGGEMTCQHAWFFSRYWMILVGTQYYGMHYSDLSAIKLHMIDDE